MLMFLITRANIVPMAPKPGVCWIRVARRNSRAPTSSSSPILGREGPQLWELNNVAGAWRDGRAEHLQEDSVLLTRPKALIMGLAVCKMATLLGLEI